MNQTSCLYEGVISHRRMEPEHEFRHRLALAYIDLAELPSLLDGRLVSPRPGLVRFRRSDYLGDPSAPLDTAVRDLVSARTGRRPRGSIRILTHLRTLGHCFNPVSFYYCMGASDEALEAVVAEVTNTPWGERHAYVIPSGSGQFDKAMHVSPFMGMDQTYTCHATAPGAGLSVRIASHRQDRPVFVARLGLRRHELTPRSLRTMTLRYPVATIRVLFLIYAHALGLRLAGAQTFAHPKGTAAERATADRTTADTTTADRTTADTTTADTTTAERAA